MEAIKTGSNVLPITQRAKSGPQNEKQPLEELTGRRGSDAAKAEEAQD